MDIKNIMKGVSPYTQSKVDKGESSDVAARVAKARANAQAESASGDRITVSSDARLVAEAARAAEGAPDVRVDRVEELRQRVKAGTYTPDARKIAEKLVQNDLEFLK